MIFTIYGFRLKGGHEVRYIGQTRYDPAKRLQFLTWEARQCRMQRPFNDWLLVDGASIEAFAIAHASTHADALRVERETINMALMLGQRLFNHDHVPASMRLVAPRPKQGSQAA